MSRIFVLRPRPEFLFSEAKPRAEARWRAHEQLGVLHSACCHKGEKRSFHGFTIFLKNLSCERGHKTSFLTTRGKRAKEGKRKEQKKRREMEKHERVYFLPDS